MIFIGPQAQGFCCDTWLVTQNVLLSANRLRSEATRRTTCGTNTPISCGNRPGTNRKRNPKRPPGDRYDSNSYRRAIHRACDRRAMQAAEGYPFAAGKGDTVGRWYKRLTGISKDIVVKHINKFRWSPNRLRHAMATEVRQQFGLEAAGSRTRARGGRRHADLRRARYEKGDRGGSEDWLDINCRARATARTTRHVSRKCTIAASVAGQPDSKGLCIMGRNLFCAELSLLRDDALRMVRRVSRLGRKGRSLLG